MSTTRCVFMKKTSWKKRIREACETAGTYQPFFDDVIDALAGILEMRDDARKKFREKGGDTEVEHTNKNGSTNKVKSPAFIAIMDCNAMALTYWKELGLTARAYKSMTGTLSGKSDSESLEEAIMNLGI